MILYVQRRPLRPLASGDPPFDATLNTIFRNISLLPTSVKLPTVFPSIHRHTLVRMAPGRASPLLADFAVHLTAGAGNFLTRQGISLFYSLQKDSIFILSFNRVGRMALVS